LGLNETDHLNDIHALNVIVCYSIYKLKPIQMADNKTKRDGRDRSKVSGSENYEIQYFKDKLGVSSQAVTGAIRATGSNDRKVLEKYLKEKQSK